MSKQASRWHGRIEDAEARCAVHGCAEPGEFRAPVSPGNFDGPGQWRLLCLDHVRAHNAAYNFFAGMSPDEIEAAQSPIPGWDRASRVFTDGGADPAPSWRDFADPLEAIGARFGQSRDKVRASRFTAREQEALRTLGLKGDADRAALRRRYRELLLRYHPDRNGGDRSHEAMLRKVIEAYQLLGQHGAFS